MQAFWEPFNETGFRYLPYTIEMKWPKQYSVSGKADLAPTAYSHCISW